MKRHPKANGKQSHICPLCLQKSLQKLYPTKHKKATIQHRLALERQPLYIRSLLRILRKRPIGITMDMHTLQNPHARHEHQETRAAIAHKGKRNTRDREHPHKYKIDQDTEYPPFLGKRGKNKIRL